MPSVVAVLFFVMVSHPSRTGNVMDFSQTLSWGTAHNLEASLTGFRERSGIDIAAVISNPTDEMKTCSDPTYNYAQELLVAWRIGGQRGDEPGVVIVFFSDNDLPMLANTPALNKLFKERGIDVAVMKEVAKSMFGSDRDNRQTPVIAGISALIDTLRFYVPDKPKPDMPIKTLAAKE